MNSESYEYEDTVQKRIEAIASHHEIPDKEGKLQVLLIEEYYASLPEHLSLNVDDLDEAFKTDIKLGREAAERWKQDGMALAFRKVMIEMKENNDTDYSKVSLDTVKQYIE